MASPSFQPLEVAQSVAAGAWLKCQGLQDKYVHVFGTFSATVQIQYTVADDDDPINLGSAFTAPGSVAVPMVVKKIRANTTVYASGTPEAVLSAQEG